MGWCFYTITSSWVAFSMLTRYCKTVDWSLTTRIKQWETNVVLSWAGVCGEGRNTSFPKNACVEASTGEIDSKGIAPVLCFASSFMREKGSNILLTLSLPEYLMEFCKVTLTFESADKILWCDHSNESSLAMKGHTIWKDIHTYIHTYIKFMYVCMYVCMSFHMVLFIWHVVLNFESVDQILWCDHSNESSLPVLTHGAGCFSKFYKMKFANLLEICLWLRLAVKRLIWVKKGANKGNQIGFYTFHYLILCGSLKKCWLHTCMYCACVIYITCRIAGPSGRPQLF